MINSNNLQQLVKDGKISSKTLERVQIAKSYIEKKYKMKKLQEEEKKKEWDSLNQKLDELKLSSQEKEIIKKDVIKKEAEFLRQTRKKISIREFEPIAIIGKGAFGEVRVCKESETNEIVAVKKMRKEDMYQKNQIMHIRTEKEILTTAKTPWVVNLRYSFQDEFSLYLVMDYLPGGDFMSLLMKKDILSEDEARFYIAEMVLAIEAIHKLNCIHRDLKPDNILIDRDGHLQLSDFGLSKLSDNTFFPMSAVLKEKENQENMKDIITNVMPSGNNNLKLNKKEEIKHTKRNRLIAFSTVGTPDYIAPEVFSQNGYGQEVDWWSVGVILFESLMGYPPFFSENPSDTCQKIVHWKKYFTIPSDSNLSLEAENLIRRLMTVPEGRLGINGAEEIKKHPFFKSVDWENIRKQKAPFIPELSNEWDTKYFDTFVEQEPFYPPEKKSKKGRKEIAFMDYTWKNDENTRGALLQALDVLEAVKLSTKNGDEKINIISELDNLQTEIEEKNEIKQNMTQKFQLEENMITTAKSNVNIIQLNNTKIIKSSSISSERKDDKAKNNSNSIKAGVNVIPLKNFNNIKNIKDNDKIDKLSPKGKELIHAATSVSPKSGALNPKLPQTAKNVNENKIQFDIKATNKSPSPSRMANSNSSKFLKKSPEIKYNKKKI